MKEKMPTPADLLWPTLKVIELLGGSAHIREISEGLASYLKLPDSVLNIPHNTDYGSESEFDNRAGWTRTYLRKVGAVDISSRGIWLITELGRNIGTEEEIRKLVKRWIQEYNKKYLVRRKVAGSTAGDENGDSDISNEREWTEDLLDVLRLMPPEAFERLCQRVLREAGFTKVEVTGHNDKGVDGTGVLRVNLLSFRIMFQCKRYSGSVGAPEIRDFQRAIVGRADKGLFITTGRFTKEAELTVVRDGAPTIDLIDGIEFCELLKRFGLGVTTEPKVQPEFFENF